VGDPMMGLMGDPIDAGLTEHSFSCPGACSSSILTANERDGTNQSGVTVISESLHMHETGVRMTHEVTRGNDVVHKSSVEVYDFDQQGNFQVPQDAYNILPGDGFRTTCYYRDGTEFGLASQEEMCIAFIMYYPAKAFQFGMAWTCPYSSGDMFAAFLGGCTQELSQSTLNDDDELKRSFGLSLGEFSVKPLDDISENIEIDMSEGQPAPAPKLELSAPATSDEDDVSENIEIDLSEGQPAPAPKEELSAPATLDEDVASGASWSGASFFLPSAVLFLATFVA